MARIWEGKEGEASLIPKMDIVERTDYPMSPQHVSLEIFLANATGKDDAQFSE